MGRGRMADHYDAIAGRSVARLSALSDGIFAIAMTILVLELRVPVLDAVDARGPLWAHGAISREQVVLDALSDVAPRLLIYVMTFLTLGIFWLAQQSQIDGLSGTTRRLTWIHLTLLFAVTLMPFSTALLGQYIEFRLALLVYWMNLLLLGLLLSGALHYARRTGMLGKAMTPEVVAASSRRIVVYQLLYAAAVATSIASTYIAIGLLVLLQLNSVIAPSIAPLNRFGHRG